MALQRLRWAVYSVLVSFSLSRRKVRVLHGVEAVDGVPHTGLHGADFR